MGYYTEIIFGARLKRDTPKNIIDTLRYVANGKIDDEKNLEAEDPVIAVDHELIDKHELYSVMRSASYYFGVCDPVSKMWYDKTAGEWVLSFRSNCKNRYLTEYLTDENGEPTTQCLQGFVKWMKPYIKSGTGGLDIYAIITTEDGEPVLYGTHGTFMTLKTDEK